MKISRHIMINFKRNPTTLLCEHCGGERVVHLPSAVNDVIKQAEAFSETHKYCKEKPCKNQNT